MSYRRRRRRLKCLSPNSPRLYPTPLAYHLFSNLLPRSLPYDLTLLYTELGPEALP